jgi:hypothetical protein
MENNKEFIYLDLLLGLVFFVLGCNFWHGMSMVRKDAAQFCLGLCVFCFLMFAACLMKLYSDWINEDELI